jgi:hypothetical protein
MKKIFLFLLVLFFCLEFAAKASDASILFLNTLVINNHLHLPLTQQVFPAYRELTNKSENLDRKEFFLNKGLIVFNSHINTYKRTLSLMTTESDTNQRRIKFLIKYFDSERMSQL